MRFELMSEYLAQIHNHWIDTQNPTKDEQELADDYYIILKNFIFRGNERKETIVSNRPTATDIEATLIARIYNVSFEDAKNGTWATKYEEE